MSKENKGDNLKDLEDKQELLRKKAFMMLIEIAFVFAIPAAIAFILGRRLDEAFGTGNTIILASLVAAFVFSWMIVIFRFKKLQKQFKDIADEIKKESGKMPADTGGNRSEDKNNK